MGPVYNHVVNFFNLNPLGNITHRASNSEVHLHTPQQKVPFSLIRCSSSNAKGAYCSCVAWGLRIYNIVESESDPLTRRPIDLFEKEPLKGNSEVHLHTPTKFGEDPSKDLEGDWLRTHKRCSNYSMMMITVYVSMNVRYFQHEDSAVCCMPFQCSQWYL